MVVFALSTLVLASVAGWFGRGPERAIALTFITWLVVDALYHACYGPMNYRVVDLPHVVLDIVVFCSIAYVMLKANRNWPLIAAAAQLVALTGHVSAWLLPEGMQRAYWAMTQFPMMIVLTSLLVGSLLHVRRQARIGPYRSWSY